MDHYVSGEHDVMEKLNPRSFEPHEIAWFGRYEALGARYVDVVVANPPFSTGDVPSYCPWSR